MSGRILIIEDEQLIRWSLRQKLEECGYEVDEAETGAEGLTQFESEVYDLIMLDYKLPDMTGLDILRQVRESDTDVVIIMMTAYSTIESAVEAMKLGAYDYVTKPFDMTELLHNVSKALETTMLRREVRELRKRLQREHGSDRIVGHHECMKSLFDTIKRVSESSASTVFLRGESGTGKDLVARIIHQGSDRALEPFMNITCTAISETLLESELFGHERGAFTDAKSMKKGLFELADRGTIFLDEVGDMPPGLQAKLLRFLEDRTFRRVGGTREIQVDVRIIAATNRDLEKAIQEGQFRNDLLYRLDVVTIDLPPLRDRGEDVILLAKYFLTKFAQDFRKTLTGLDESAVNKLMSYDWPGNVRELRNVIERGALLTRAEVLASDDLVIGRPGRSDTAESINLPPEGIDLHEIENQLVRKALQRANNNQTQAAKLLSLSRDAFRYRMEKLGLL
jgi:DNA-binding NtrC family response regulator